MDFLLDFILHIDQHMINIVQSYHAWTYAILFLIIFCETGLVVTPFLPGDSLLFVAGAIAALPGMPIEIHFLSLILFIAAVLGDSCNYMIGHFFGRKLFNNPHSKIFKQSHLDKTHDFYKKYGGKTIILARFVPIVRTFAPFVAGMGKMHYYYFMMYNVVGGAAWVAIFTYAGYFFGDLPFVQENLKLLIVAIIFISILPAVVEVVRAKMKSRKENSGIQSDKN
ncbi:DedA family protein [Bacteroides reticulotermitis]|uniref:DedA protein n=2 Tax=Bacteroides reticulotermitis TaxID=1133319 RepID=W4UV39_9BACE|nr:DedA family protein [Bacteroides reticulotermitis]MBB4042845.1 membrane-associated protein [Bacteroides reticulotermitis]GAE85090.1 DedA protein [Bacteroides reticulotermitis JCM 10512]HJD77166.1 DedA family protein [Bacteroides reticulotermitis]